ncbi:MAG TPA: hypothetical protein DCS28_00985 [Candidatus Moranbacteria bacterium]|nr:hypothetical protein [Candidatus Moranbacteria bacterium]HAT74603.1 hypothetical protein [Candidatus Moranbacteria bacterium]
MHFPRGIDPDIVNAWNGQPREMITLVALEIFGKLPRKPALLGPSENIVTLPERTESFVVEKIFAKYRGSNFDSWFLGRVEEPMAAATLHAQLLLRYSTDPAIIEDLGGYFKARITIADINHAKESGALRKNCVYIVYVEDKVRLPEDEPFAHDNEKGGRSVLRAVFFGWHDDGWGVDAYQVSDPGGWDEGYWILSRNSLKSQSSKIL